MRDASCHMDHSSRGFVNRTWREPSSLSPEIGVLPHVVIITEIPSNDSISTRRGFQPINIPDGYS